MGEAQPVRRRNVLRHGDGEPPVFIRRAGYIAHKAPTWFAIGLLIFAAGHRQGRRAAVRGGVCSGLAMTLAGGILKPIIHRPRPAPARRRQHPPMTSSFPSGHAASQLAFWLGLVQGLGFRMVPLGGLVALGHWSMVHRRSHYMSDVVAGWCIGVGSVWLVSRVWRPPPRSVLSPEGWRS